MSDVFISYARSDRPKARVLAEALERHGWSAWWDDKIPLGKTWEEVIEQQLDAARCIIVMWSKESVASDWVKTEAREGKRRGILIPALIEDARIPLDFRHIQTANLVGWNPASHNPEFDRFLEELAGILGARQSGGENFMPPHPNGQADAHPGESEQPVSALEEKPKALPVAPKAASEGTRSFSGSAELELGAARILRAHTDAVWAVTFSPDGQTLASGGGGTFFSGDTMIRLWRVTDGKLLRELKLHKKQVTSVAFAPNGAILASSSWEGIRLCQMPDGNCVRILGKGGYKSISFSPDGTLLASALDLWRVSDGELVRRFEPPDRVVETIAFSPDGTLLAAACRDGLYVWRVVDGTVLIKRIEEHALGHSVAFSPNGKMLASPSKDFAIGFWSVPEGAEINVLKGSGWVVNLLAFSPDGGFLASAHGGHFSLEDAVTIWRVADGKLLTKLELPGRVGSIAWSPDGAWLAAGCVDKLVHLWPVRQGIGR